MVNGVENTPAVREQLGRLAALEATIGGLVRGQIDAFESWPETCKCHPKPPHHVCST